MIVQRGYLVSLLDIMRRFSASLFMNLNALLWFAAHQGDEEPIWEDSKLKGLNAISLFEPDCVAMGLTTSAITIRKIQALLSQSTITYGQYRELAQELQTRLVDETSVTEFLSLSMLESEYYNHPWKGWGEVIDRFPDTVSDIEEAAKCFALSRYAAAVYHSIQVVEIGLLELGRFIGVNDSRSGWTSVSNRLEQIVKTKYDNRTDFEKKNHEFIEQIRATIDVLKNAWRNKISHAQGRAVLMTRDFTPDVTQEILIATRAFMRRLADGLPRQISE